MHRRLLPESDELGWTPYLWLIYLSFLYFSWFFRSDVTRLEVGMTVTSTIIFLPLYFYGFWNRGMRGLIAIIGIALLGAIVGPINWGASCYFIYAAGFIGQFNRIRPALLTLAGLHAVVIVETLAMDLPFPFWAPPLLFGSIVGAANYYFSQQARKRVQLRLGQDEVRRLAAMAERERIGRDLHDLLGHTLSLITIKSELAQRLFERDPEAAQRELHDIEQVSRKAMEEVREAVSGYRAVGLASELANARLALEAHDVRFDYRFDARPLPTEADQTLALVLREAVTNVVRHAQAESCRVRFRREGSEGVLEVSDDGRNATLDEGHGLTGMRERLDRLGGSLELQTGERTLLRARLPLPDLEEPADPTTAGDADMAWSRS
ncbi:hypothetical protein ABI59_00620 [Acidobacteria bacterium Mor1]|nr:hypothetical protein ABI59_00620 [Acidobacteria bacterium Mor1]